uniref:Uncharacterized protein n=1 Tax=Anopheles coluzzii TaxID=1518534 RepID=A0A8W7PY23_ANOCL
MSTASAANGAHSLGPWRHGQYGGENCEAGTANNHQIHHSARPHENDVSGALTAGQRQQPDRARLHVAEMARTAFDSCQLPSERKTTRLRANGAAVRWQRSC